MGAWIETGRDFEEISASAVAPYVGAWIETFVRYVPELSGKGRTLRGCVD